MKTTLPWADVPPPIYTGHDRPEPPKPWVIPGSWVMAALLVYGGITTRYKVALVFAFLYVITLITKKDTVVTSRGLESFYQMRISTHTELWPWEDMFSVTYEFDYRHTDKVALYFTMGDRTRRKFFDKRDKDAILAMAKEHNPGIRVYNADDTKQKAEALKAKKR